MYTVVIWNWAVTYGIGESGALRSDGFQKIPARPQIVFNMFTCLNQPVGWRPFRHRNSSGYVTPCSGTFTIRCKGKTTSEHQSVLANLSAV